MGGQHKALTVLGWILTVLVGLLLSFSATMKFSYPPQVAEQFVGKFGYPEDLVVPIGIAEVCCVLVYLVPRTAVLGAILLTGYLGGATATHVRVHDDIGSVVAPVIAGVVTWLGIYLRDPRLRALLPWRRAVAEPISNKPPQL
jgi:DoxX-like protein